MKKPADSTGDLILACASLVRPRQVKRHVSADTQPFGRCDVPNNIWNADFKGQFQLGNRKWCYPLTVSDNFSRFLFLCECLLNTQAAPVIPLFERLFKEFGLPYAIRTDNGVPFASTALGGISQLSKWWIDLGIRPERIKPGCPKQNRRHERMHRSLKACIGEPKYDLLAQQKVLEHFHREYNTLRSHESLGRQTPETIYQPSNRVYTGKIEPYDYSDAQLRKVKGSGEVKWLGGIYYLSQVLTNEFIAFIPCADGVWDMYYGTATENRRRPFTPTHFRVRSGNHLKR